MSSASEEKVPTQQTPFLPFEQSLRESCSVETQRPLASQLTHNKRKGEDSPTSQSIVKDL